MHCETHDSELAIKKIPKPNEEHQDDIVTIVEAPNKFLIRVAFGIWNFY